MPLSVYFSQVGRDSKETATITSLRSIDEVRSFLKEAGSNQEVVTDFISVKGTAANILGALVLLNREDDDGICRTLEKLLTKIRRKSFHAGTDYVRTRMHSAGMHGVLDA